MHHYHQWQVILTPTSKPVVKKPTTYVSALQTKVQSEGHLFLVERTHQLMCNDRSLGSLFFHQLSTLQFEQTCFYLSVKSQARCAPASSQGPFTNSHLSAFSPRVPIGFQGRVLPTVHFPTTPENPSRWQALAGFPRHWY